MPLPSEPKVMGDTVAAKEYGARVKPAALQKASAAKPTKSVKSKKTMPPAVTPAAPQTTAAAKKSVKKTAVKKNVAPKTTPVSSDVEKLGASRLRSPRNEASETKPRLFVLDTNVLLHDPMSIFRFEEHDVFLPMMTLEELDNHKTGLSDIARNARQVSRSIDQLIESEKGAVKDGIHLNEKGRSLYAKTIASCLLYGTAGQISGNNIDSFN